MVQVSVQTIIKYFFYVFITFICRRQQYEMEELKCASSDKRRLTSQKLEARPKIEVKSQAKTMLVSRYQQSEDHKHANCKRKSTYDYQIHVPSLLIYPFPFSSSYYLFICCVYHSIIIIFCQIICNHSCCLFCYI